MRSDRSNAYIKHTAGIFTRTANTFRSIVAAKYRVVAAKR
jgi:hypothetical protein